MIFYKFKSKHSDYWFPLKPTDDFKELSKHQYKLIEISKEEYNKLLNQK